MDPALIKNTIFILLIIYIIMTVLIKKAPKFFLSWFVNKESDIPVWKQSLSIIAVSLLVAIGFTFGYQHIYNIPAGVATPYHIAEEALSNIYRNILLVAFAVFSICLAIWARWANGKQLEYTRKQLVNSAKINRNDRFAKSIELLDSERWVSNMGGLNILQDLSQEHPESEHIRCTNIICDWLRDVSPLSGRENERTQKKVQFAIDIISKNLTKEQIECSTMHREKILIEAKQKNKKYYWPHMQEIDFTDINFFEAYLVGANFKDANLTRAFMQEADTEYANLTNANIEKANFSATKNISDKQILSAYYVINAPTLPASLNPIKKAIPKKPLAKKATAKKATAKKANARKPII